MSEIYFHCDNCFTDEYNGYIYVNDSNTLKNVLKSDCVSLIRYNRTCKKCADLIRHIGYAYVIGDKHDGLNMLNNAVVVNDEYMNKYGLFWIQASNLNKNITISICITSEYLLGSRENLTIEDFLNVIKLNSVVGIIEKDVPIDDTIEYLDQHLADKGYHMKNMFCTNIYYYYLITEKPLIKSVIKLN